MSRTGNHHLIGRTGAALAAGALFGAATALAASAAPWAAGLLAGGALAALAAYLGGARQSLAASRLTSRLLARHASELSTELLAARTEEGAFRSRLQAVINSLEAPLYLTDRRFQLVMANKACFRFYGLPSTAHLDELRLRIGTHEDASGLRGFIDRAVSNPDRSVVAAMTRPSGEDFYKAYSAPILVAGKAEGRVVVYQDMSLEQQFSLRVDQEVASKTQVLQEALSELREQDQARAAFIANMSHELRTPLHYLMTHVSALEEGLLGPLTPAQGEALSKILDGITRLTALMNDVLDVSKLEAHRIELDLQPTDPLELIAAAMEFQWAQAEKKGVRFSLVQPSDLPLVRVDFGRMHQVLTNLLSNALKFTPPGGSVTVSAAVEGETLRVEVADSGIGIAPDHHEHLFDRFYMVNDPVARRVPGTGLGLAICKQLVELHGGRIGLDSEPGRGARFFFTVPIVREPLLPEGNGVRRTPTGSLA
ncbi:Alkaline phosphatase synthesis sensor protein PhoR [compost metagenome]